MRRIPIFLSPQMPQLKWNPYEFIECLEVIPSDNGYGAELVYKIERDDLCLEVTVWQNESIVELHLLLADSGHTISRFCLVVSDEIRHEHGKEGESLLFKGVAISPSPLYFNDQDRGPFDSRNRQTGMDIRLAVKPAISILFLRAH